MKTARSGRTDMVTDETSCAAFCQHPACWQSNTRREKGFPIHIDKDFTERKPIIENSLPEMTVYNLIEDYGDDERDRFPAKHVTRSSELNSIPVLCFPVNTVGQLCSTPLVTPESVVKPAKKKTAPKMKVVEVQELFDVEDLESRWDETFITKQCYVWVPNPNRKPLAEQEEDLKMITDGTKSGSQPIPAKDVTEQLVPEELEHKREELRLPFYAFPVIKYKKRQATRCRSPVGRGRNHGKYSSYSQNRSTFDSDGINNLLDLPRDVLMQVLDHLNESDFSSKEKINSVIQDFKPPLVRDPTGISIGTADALKQKKMALLRGKKRNIRESHLMEARPIFQLDDDLLIETMSEANSPRHQLDTGSGLQSPDGSLSIQGFSKSKKPLPAIERLRGVRSSKDATKKKVASVSLGLPALPTGIKHTRPFTYRKSDTMDLSIGPMPTPPTSVRSSVTYGSDHGTTLNVNLTSPTDDRSSRRQEIDIRLPVVPVSSAHPGSPANLPKAPVCTPATYRESSYIRDGTDMSLQNQTASRECVALSSQRDNDPVNTNLEIRNAHEINGLKTIPERSTQNNKTSPIAPEKQADNSKEALPPHMANNTNESIDDTEYESHARTLSINSCPGIVGPVNTMSTYSSPDPWPQVTEASFDGDGEESVKGEPYKHPRSTVHRESEQEYFTRKMLEDRIKGTSPAPPPPSPEGKEFDRGSSVKPMSRDSETMEALMEEEDEESDEDDSEALVVTVSKIVPNPLSLVKEKSFHSFVNVDIPAESLNGSATSEHPKLDRRVQSFVSVDIPASIGSDNPQPEDTTVSNEIATGAEDLNNVGETKNEIEDSPVGAADVPVDESSQGPAKELSEDLVEESAVAASEIVAEEPPTELSEGLSKGSQEIENNERGTEEVKPVMGDS